MRLRTTAILAALVALSCLIAPTALAQQPVCGSHKTVADTLKQRYAETPVSMGVTVGGAVVEIYASPEGTWTLLITQPNGVTCLIAAGKDWENLPKLAKGAAI